MDESIRQSDRGGRRRTLHHVTHNRCTARSKLPRCREAHYLNHPVDVSEGGAGAAAALLQAEVRAEFPERGQKLRLLRDVGAAALADAVAQLERLVESRLEVLQVALGLRQQSPEGRRVRQALVDGDDERHREFAIDRRRGGLVFWSLLPSVVTGHSRAVPVLTHSQSQCHLKISKVM